MKFSVAILKSLNNYVAKCPICREVEDRFKKDGVSYSLPCDYCPVGSKVISSIITQKTKNKNFYYTCGNFKQKVKNNDFEAQRIYQEILINLREQGD